ncbi:MAG: tRNA (adenosine(37)-N6)-threonylcarbamoyltransferase complex transferase subunit TsaD [Candidatus Pacebacteria bacterium]|nr:tRNA (adenosine(37)-N6)-threonylcarbamoyltransferase complex transferase subunit TsaD [Candidatus Paceibacterota bacterium]MCF7863004.1 tRNA (adenosine(37)-N6)-threonylcarbamoyltransferase complex transferase subunit TsaD [Candidatus Paceibacterota bacterium]
MKILAIETSCDDTSITILEAKGGLKNASFKILAHTLNSQSIHKAYGGVFPAMAKKEHIKNLPLLLKEALKKAKIPEEKLTQKNHIDLITVTYGPGLEPCLWTGITFAKELSEKWNIPIVPVNHMEGHIVSVFAKSKGTFKVDLSEKKFPMLTLLVSGGHTEIVLIKNFGEYEIIGKTLDDAVGEAFDKVARMLGLEYPGGPKISKLAEEGRKDIKTKYNFNLPRPMLKSPNLDFSFAGLKTAVLYSLKKIPKINIAVQRELAMEFENAVTDTLVYKLKKADEIYHTKNIIIAGGVSANKHIQKVLKKVFGKDKILLPEKKLTGDNALMIGVAGYLQYAKNPDKATAMKEIKATGNLCL